MLPEQQQRILGYFIEEAKDHLETIEQGLLDLQNTLKDSEMVNAVFRAAHSIKGGAAMLGFDSIQQTAHRLEDYFKVLKECPQLPVDQKLKSLLLRVFDTLQELLELLETSLSLPEDIANNTMSQVEPVFEAVKQHLEVLVNQASQRDRSDSLRQEESDLSPLTSAQSPSETLAFDSFDSLFDKAQDPPLNLATVETDFGDLFDEEEYRSQESGARIQNQNMSPDSCILNARKLMSGNPRSALAPPESLTDTDGTAFGEDEPELQLQPELNSEELFFSLETFAPATAANDLDSDSQVNDAASGSFEVELTMADPWDEQPLEEATYSATQQTTADGEQVDEHRELELTIADPWDENPEAEGRRQKSGVGSRESGVGSRESGVGSQEAGVRRQKADMALEFSNLTSESSNLTPDFLEADITLDPSILTSEALDFSELEELLPEKASEDFSELEELLVEDALEDFSELEALLTQKAPFADASATPALAEEYRGDFFGSERPSAEASGDEFDQLDALLDLDAPVAEASGDEFDQLDALLDLDAPVAEASGDEFDQLDALLDLDAPVVGAATQAANSASLAKATDEEFAGLDDLLSPTNQQELLDQKPSQKETQAAPINHAQEARSTRQEKQTAPPQTQSAPPKAANTRRLAFEQTMRVPVKQLDNLNNLVGELVVYRNRLVQDRERLRQFLDNLLHQVHQLGSVGVKMHELYERSLLEASLINIRQGSRTVLLDNSAAEESRHATGVDFDALEMDRFTGFHTLSQDIIELIVRVRESTSDIEFVTDETELVARQLQQVTSQLQEGLTRSRMIPFAQIAERLPRAVRDIALKCGKQAELQVEGEDTLIDKMILEQLYDPMTHLVNNSITHGIETPQEREAKGKSPLGQIMLRAFLQGNQTVISVSDDGAGIDCDRVLTKAIQKGLITVSQAKVMSRQEVYSLLFHPGFSTRDQVDEFAGRGVGMDVVKTSLNDIKGTISTDSSLGKGTTFTIRLPLTLSICKALCCLSDKTRIAFPMDGVEDMIEIAPQNVVTNAEGQSCIPWDESLLPFIPLKELLKYNRQLTRGSVYGNAREDDFISVVVLRSADKILALQVDQVLGEQEIVIKQFEAPAPKPVGVAGATVLGDGRIMPIADVLELFDLSAERLQRVDNDPHLLTSTPTVVPKTPAAVKTEPTVLIIDDSITVRELLSMTFKNAGYRVEQARDGQEAWEKLRDGLPCDLVFCDIEMPRMDGLELLSRMQKDPNLKDLPIAMLTSRGADRHRQMAVQLGARGYFTKPYLEEALLDGAQRMLKGEVLLTASSNT